MSIDVTDATFETEVLARSDKVPVVVDLWAPWCGPCSTLGPILEKVVDATEGKVVLVKINVDENPRRRRRSRCSPSRRCTPCVTARSSNGFIGAQAESAVRQFVDELLPSEDRDEVADLVAAGDEQSLRSALELEPGNETGRDRAGGAARRRRASPTRRSACSSGSPRPPRPAASRRWHASVTLPARAPRRRGDGQTRRPARTGQGRRRGATGVRRPARGARSGRSAYRRLPQGAHLETVLTAGAARASRGLLVVGRSCGAGRRGDHARTADLIRPWAVDDERHPASRARARPPMA